MPALRADWITASYLAALSCEEEIHCGPVDGVAVEQWHRGRVVLIDDAAHASSPMMGQGGCMAMEDACALAESLRQDTTVAEALESYVARRQPRVSWVHQEGDAVAQSFRLPPAVRNAALRQYGDRMFQRRLLRRRSWRHSPLFSGHLTGEASIRAHPICAARRSRCAGGRALR